MKSVFFILLLIGCFSCTSGKKDEGNSAINTKSDTVTQLVFVDNYPLEELDLSGLDMDIDSDSLISYLSKAKSLRKELIDKLNNSSPLQADSMYWEGEFRFTDTPEFERLVELVTPIVDRWGLNGGEAARLQDIKVLELLKDEGLEPEYYGEGYAELRFNPHFYYNIYQSFLPETSRDFLRLLADNDNIIEMDAGLVVPLDSLVARCIRWEEFLNKYPDIEQRRMIISQYGRYMGLIMFCTYDNTPAFDYRKTKRVDDYVLDEINGLVKKYPDCTTIDILKQYLAELEKSDYTYSEQLEDKIMAMGMLRDFDRADAYY